MSTEAEELVAGREMDIAVHAAVFGDDWRKECSRFRQSRCNGRIYTHCGACGRAGHGNCYGEGRGPIEIACADSCGAPSYSTRIDDAWLIVEQMRERGYTLSLNEDRGCDKRDDEPIIWEAHFRIFDGRAKWIGEGNTAPLAICRAVLSYPLPATRS